MIMSGTIVRALDSRAVLTEHGWAGDGHALQRGGIKRPILVSRKSNTKGLGAVANAEAAWWDAAYSAQLAGVSIDSSSNSSSKAHGVSCTAHDEISRAFSKKLYRHFVYSHVLEGTITRSRSVKDSDSKSTLNPAQWSESETNYDIPPEHIHLSKYDESEKLLIEDDPSKDGKKKKRNIAYDIKSDKHSRDSNKKRKKKRNRDVGNVREDDFVELKESSGSKKANSLKESESRGSSERSERKKKKRRKDKKSLT